MRILLGAVHLVEGLVFDIANARRQIEPQESRPCLLRIRNSRSLLAGLAILCCVDRWLRGKQTVRWTAPLLSDDAKLSRKAICHAEDYIFAACQPTAGLLGVVYVYSAKDEKLVGRISSGKEYTQRTGWVDLNNGLRARQLPDGRYCLTQEENFHGKVLVILWTPANAGSPAAK